MRPLTEPAGYAPVPSGVPAATPVTKSAHLQGRVLRHRCGLRRVRVAFTGDRLTRFGGVSSPPLLSAVALAPAAPGRDPLPAAQQHLQHRRDAAGVAVS